MEIDQEALLKQIKENLPEKYAMNEVIIIEENKEFNCIGRMVVKGDKCYALALIKSMYKNITDLVDENDLALEWEAYQLQQQVERLNKVIKHLKGEEDE